MTREPKSNVTWQTKPTLEKFIKVETGDNWQQTWQTIAILKKFIKVEKGDNNDNKKIAGTRDDDSSSKNIG